MANNWKISKKFDRQTGIHEIKISIKGRTLITSRHIYEKEAKAALAKAIEKMRREVETA